MMNNDFDKFEQENYMSKKQLEAIKEETCNPKIFNDLVKTKKHVSNSIKCECYFINNFKGSSQKFSDK